tara:strand:+ start:1614 stop:1952 length:339 start_codon:yes stop_codon:yes gene_type:complete
MALADYIAKAAHILYEKKHGVEWCGIAEDGVAIDQTYSDREMPTKAEIEAEAQKLWDAAKAIQYQKDRRVEYPDLGEQLDMIYHDMKNSTTTHADAVEKVKKKWPKDNSGPK